jgi:hypothetical protein
MTASGEPVSSNPLHSTNFEAIPGWQAGSADLRC